MPFFGKFGTSRARPLLRVTISTDQANITLRTIANNAGYTSGDVQITINSGVDIYSTSSSTSSCTAHSESGG